MMTDREKAMTLFGPYPVKCVDAERVRAEVPPNSAEEQRIWTIWEDIYRERHANNSYCDDDSCDECCGHALMGDGW